MKESVISFIYRYHFWAFQFKRLGFIIIYWPIHFIPYLLFPQKRILIKQNYSKCLNKRDVLKSYLFNKDPVGSGIRNTNVFTDSLLFISFLALVYEFRSAIYAITIIVLLYTCALFSYPFIEKKTGFAYTFGPIYKKYFKKFLDEPLLKQSLWFLFFTSLYTMIIMLLLMIIF